MSAIDLVISQHLLRLRTAFFDRRETGRVTSLA
jgi:hypothetical protein